MMKTASLTFQCGGMPILDIEIILKPGEELAPGLARGLADRLGEVFGAAPLTTWVKVRSIPAEQFAENKMDFAQATYPVFVAVLKTKLPSPEQMPYEISQLTPLIAHLCSREPEHVHILYLPEGSGRIAFGGSLQT